MNSCQDLIEHDGMESRSFPDLLSPLAWFGLWNTRSFSCAQYSWGGASALKKTGGKLCCFGCLSSGIFGTLGVHFECYMLRRSFWQGYRIYILHNAFYMRNAWQSEFMSVLWCKSLLFKEYLHIFQWFFFVDILLTWIEDRIFDDNFSFKLCTSFLL